MSVSIFPLLTQEIRTEADVLLGRQRARQLAALLGFDVQNQTRVATAVSEIARNAYEHAGSGQLEFVVETPDRPGGSTRLSTAGQTLVITVRDQGPGLPPSVEQRAAPRGLGVGLADAAHLVDALNIDSRPGATAIVMRKALPTGALALTVPQLRAAADKILATLPDGPLTELQTQNQELARTLDELHAQQESLDRVNRELAQTNTGVLALYDELETLHRVGNLLASQLDLKTLLQAIIDVTTELTDARFGAFFFRDVHHNVWRLQAVAGPSRGVLIDLPIGNAADFFGVDFDSPEEVLAAREDDEPHPVPCGDSKFARALGDRYTLRSCLTIPVTSDAEPLGAMVFGSDQADAFTERSERIVSSIASQAAVGIEKAELFEKVQSTSAAKDRFLAMLSHELRTPLNPVLAVVSSLVHDDRVPAEVQQDLNVVLRNVRLEARLIDDLLDLSRIINGKLQLQREPVDLHALIQAVVNICAEEVAAKGHTLTVSLQAPRAQVFGDSARLQQVLWNILKNAVKFTLPGGHISIQTAADGDDAIEVSISDDGIGIEPTALSRIFGAFEQAGERTTARFGGLGLGLAITRAFVELHEGTIRAISAGPNQGAQIIFRLPLLTAAQASASSTHMIAPVPSATASAQTSDPSPAPTTVSTPAGATLLLVDDHADTLAITSRLLTRRGYRVLTASSCQTALLVAEQNPVDLIISDLGLPDGSGLTLLPSLRQIRPVPAIALSGYGMEEDVRQTRQAGYDEHLTKPIDFALLAQAVARLLTSG